MGVQALLHACRVGRGLLHIARFTEACARHRYCTALPNRQRLARLIESTAGATDDASVVMVMVHQIRQVDS